MSTTTQEHPLAAKPVEREETKAHQIFKQSDRIFLGTPCYGGNVKQEFMTSITDLMMHLSARFYQEDGSVAMQPLVAEMAFLENESHIDRARNKIANRFLRSTCDWLLFVDSDIVFGAGDVMRLWIHGMNGAKIVCGAYAMKGIVPQFAVAAVEGAKSDEHGKIEVVHCGTGFMLIHRSVFEELAKQKNFREVQIVDEIKVKISKAIQEVPSLTRDALIRAVLGAVDTVKISDLAEEYNLGTNDPDRALGIKTNRAFFKSGVRELPVAGPLWLSEDYMLCWEHRKLGDKLYIDRNINLEHCGSLKFPPDPRQVAAAMKELRRIGAPGLPKELI